MPTNDQKLYQLISSSTIQTVEGVIAVLRGLDSSFEKAEWTDIIGLQG
jgi:hypothetical protein